MIFQTTSKFVIVFVRSILEKRGLMDLRVYCSHFPVIFKFLIVFVRLILGKVWIEGFTGSSWEIDVRYEFDLKIILKGLGLK